MSRYETLVLDDFRGGIRESEAAGHFEENEWSELKGFILRDDGSLRAQWPMQEIIPTPSGQQCHTVERLTDGDGGSSLYALYLTNSSQNFRYFLSPNVSEGAVYSESAALAGTALANADLSTPSIFGGSVQIYSRICRVPVPQSGATGYRTGLLFNGASLNNASASVVAYKAAGSSSLRFVQTVSHYPNDSTADACPLANVGVMWNGVLMLGDTWWRDDPSLAFSTSNKRRTPNGIWMSMPGQPFRWELDRFLTVGEDESSITGMYVIPTGLLVLTGKGVYLLRGTPSDFSLEVLREGLGARSGGSCYWDHEGTVCFVSAQGEVWQTNGQEFARLDEALQRPSSSTNMVRGFGPYLILQWGSRVLALRRTGSGDSIKGAWTEFSIPPVDALIGQQESCFYFVRGGNFGRFVDVNVWVGDLSTDISPRGRGLFNGNPYYFPLTITTRTLEGGDGHQKTFWKSFAVKASVVGEMYSERPATAGVESTHPDRILEITVGAGPLPERGPIVESSTPQLIREVDKALTRPAAYVTDNARRTRGDFRVKGVGSSREFAASVELQGNVVVEAMSVEFSPATPSRSLEGK